MASNSNSNYKAKVGSLKSPQATNKTKTASTQNQTKAASMPKTTTTSCAPSATTYKQTPTSTQATQQGKTAFQDRYDRNAEKGLELTDLIKREKEKAGITTNQGTTIAQNYETPQKKATNPAAINYSSLNSNTITGNRGNTSKKEIPSSYYNNANYSMPKKDGGYYSSPNYSMPKNAITSIKTKIDTSNINNYNSVYNSNGVELFNIDTDPIKNQKINVENIDLSKISISASDAQNSNFKKVNENIWKNADLNITKREDGTFIIKNGTEAIGFTTKEGLNGLFTDQKNNTTGQQNNPNNKPKTNNYTNPSTLNAPYDPTLIKLNELDTKRLSATEEGAYTGNFTNLNLAAYDTSKLHYEVNENGTVSIINNGKTIGYTDIFGIPERKNTKYNDNSPVMDYLVNTNANHSITSVGDLTQQYLRDNIRSLDPHANLGGDYEERLARFQELFPTITSASSPYVSRSAADAQMETIEVPIWDGEKRTTMKLTVHNKLVENYKGAFSELADMKYRVNPSTTAAYVYRNTQGTSGSGGRLSDHSFGGAFDLNWDVNPIQYGKNTSSSDRVITDEVAGVMNKYGFTWGGDWSGEKDYMHFSYTGS